MKGITGEGGPHDIAEAILRQRQENKAKPCGTTESGEKGNKKTKMNTLKRKIKKGYNYSDECCSSLVLKYVLLWSQSSSLYLQHCLSGAKMEGSSLECRPNLTTKNKQTKKNHPVSTGYHQEPFLK